MVCNVNTREKRDAAAEFQFEGIIGTSSYMKEVFNIITQVAPTNATVFIEGETGTGKELIARAIHKNSLRAKQPFIALNCAIPSESLVESELFGHEKGAFTNAFFQKKGYFERADQGTLFLDEIADMNLNIQAKILRVIEDGQFERIGGNRTLKTDFRLVVASNKNLEELIEVKKFREDLFYRVSVIKILLPPLRKRKEDILSLAEFFIRKYSKELDKYPKNLSSEAKQYITTHSWPGNIRELENVVKRAEILSKQDIISLSDLQLDSSEHKDEEFDCKLEIFKITNNGDLNIERAKKKAKEQIEQTFIREALQKTLGRKKEAAKLLGISSRALYTKIKQYEISIKK